jgi:hypothetical protein
LLLSCCDGVAAPRAAAWHRDQVPAANSQRRCGQQPGTNIKYLRQTTSGAAGYSMGFTIKHMRGAAGISLGTTIK